MDSSFECFDRDSEVIAALDLGGSEVDIDSGEGEVILKTL